MQFHHWLALWLVTSVATASVAWAADCSSAEAAAENAEDEARKAYRADTIAECHHHLKRARDYAREAQSAASSCDCDEAESNADDAERYAKRGLGESKLDDCQSQARRARNEADEASDEAVNCSLLKVD